MCVGGGGGGGGGVPARSDTNRPVQSQKMARISLRFQIRVVKTKAKGAEQLCSYCEADLRLCFHIGKNPVFS